MPRCSPRTSSPPHSQSTVFVINPGSTSTEIALFNRGGQVWWEAIRHQLEVLLEEVPAQLDQRRAEDLLAGEPLPFTIAGFHGGRDGYYMSGELVLVSESGADTLSLSLELAITIPTEFVRGS